MKIAKVEIAGFKSFRDPTTIAFHDGVTAISGKSGSGKTNLIESIRWVLEGPSLKDLRCKSNSDLFSKRTDICAAARLADVTVTLSDTARPLGKTVSVTRRASRSGGDEYLIDDSVCGAEDIERLVADKKTGARGFCFLNWQVVQEIMDSFQFDSSKAGIGERVLSAAGFLMKECQSAGGMVLIMDDVLCLLDGEQSDKAAGLLGAVAGSLQIILVTNKTAIIDGAGMVYEVFSTKLRTSAVRIPDVVG